MMKFDTKVTRLLEANNIPYRLLPHDRPVFTVAEAAAQRGVVAEEMVKSILLRDKDRRYVMACVTGEARLDPQAVRTCLPAEWKRLTFASAAEIEALTGFVMGAVAPLALPEGLPVVMDEVIAQYANVNISSGDPLAGLELKASDLIALSGATLAPITRSADAADVVR